MRNILALAKEAIEGDVQALNEFNDLLEENDIEKINNTIYYCLFPLDISNYDYLIINQISFKYKLTMDHILLSQKGLPCTLLSNINKNLLAIEVYINLMHNQFNIFNLFVSYGNRDYVCRETKISANFYSQINNANKWLEKNISNLNLNKIKISNRPRIEIYPYLSLVRQIRNIDENIEVTYADFKH